MLLLAASNSTEHFTILLGFVAAVLTVVSMIAGLLWKGGRALWRQIEATEENTEQIKELSKRMERVEAATTAAEAYTVERTRGRTYHVYSGGRRVLVA